MSQIQTCRLMTTCFESCPIDPHMSQIPTCHHFFEPKFVYFQPGIQVFVNYLN